MNILHRDKKLRFVLSKRLQAIVVGMILGDANLNRRGRYHRLLVKHGKSQYKLISWEREQLSAITAMPINSFVQEVKGKPYEFCQFVTLTHPVFTALHKAFYPKGKKIVPREIGALLCHPISLATWIMDDGAKAPAGMTLQTHSFSESAVRRLKSVLQKNFNLRTNIHANKGKKIMYVPQAEIGKLRKLVGRYILPEYLYKFPDPVETAR